MYKIKDWDKHFENKRTATFERRQHLEISTHYRDQNLLWLLDHKDGAAHFGIFILICEWHACTTKPRHGYLTHNGKVNGFPMTAQKFSVEFGIPAKLIQACLDRVSTSNVEWLEEIPDVRSVNTAQTQRTSSVHAAPLTIPNHTTLHHTIYSDDFQEFWKEYPRKVGKGKAWESWQKLNPPLDKCLEVVKAFKESDEWADPKFIPHPTTWLNQRRWDDELPEVSSGRDEYDFDE